MDVSTVPPPATDEERARAVGAVLRFARDADDARLVLELLGLHRRDVERYAEGV